MKNKSNVVLINGLIFVLVSIGVMIGFKLKTNIFWLSYGFFVLAFIIHFLSILIFLKKANNIDQVFLGMPIANISIYYLYIEAIAALGFMIYQFTAPFVAAFIVQFVILAIYLVMIIVAFSGTNHIKSVEEDIKNKTFSIKSKQIDVEMLLDSCADEGLKHKLNNLIQTIKYSDPMTNAQISDIDAQINGKLNELSTFVHNGDVLNARNACDSLESLYKNRNAKLKISK